MNLIIKSALMKKRAMTTKPMTFLIALAFCIMNSNLVAQTETKYSASIASINTKLSKRKRHLRFFGVKDRKTKKKYLVKFREVIDLILVSNRLRQYSDNKFTIAKTKEKKGKDCQNIGSRTSVDLASLEKLIPKIMEVALNKEGKEKKLGTRDTIILNYREKNDHKIKHKEVTPTIVRVTKIRDQYATKGSQAYYIQLQVPHQESGDNLQIGLVLLAEREKGLIGQHIGASLISPDIKGKNNVPYKKRTSKEVMNILSTADLFRSVRLAYNHEKKDNRFTLLNKNKVKVAAPVWETHAPSFHYTTLEEILSKKNKDVDGNNEKKKRNYILSISQDENSNFIWTQKTLDAKGKGSNDLTSYFLYKNKKFSFQKKDDSWDETDSYLPEKDPKNYDIASISEGGKYITLSPNKANEELANYGNLKNIIDAIIQSTKAEGTGEVNHTIDNKTAFAGIRKETGYIYAKGNSEKMKINNVNSNIKNKIENFSYEHSTLPFETSDYGPYFTHRIDLKFKDGKNKNQSLSFLLVDKDLLSGLKWEAHSRPKEGDKRGDYKQKKWEECGNDVNELISWATLESIIRKKKNSSIFKTNIFKSDTYKYHSLNSENKSMHLKITPNEDTTRVKEIDSKNSDKTVQDIHCMYLDVDMDNSYKQLKVSGENSNTSQDNIPEEKVETPNSEIRNELLGGFNTNNDTDTDDADSTDVSYNEFTDDHRIDDSINTSQNKQENKSSENEYQPYEKTDSADTSADSSGITSTPVVLALVAGGAIIAGGAIGMITQSNNKKEEQE